jgi:hypothetical protein
MTLQKPNPSLCCLRAPAGAHRRPRPGDHGDLHGSRHRFGQDGVGERRPRRARRAPPKRRLLFSQPAATSRFATGRGEAPCFGLRSAEVEAPTLASRRRPRRTHAIHRYGGQWPFMPRSRATHSHARMRPWFPDVVRGDPSAAVAQGRSTIAGCHAPRNRTAGARSARLSAPSRKASRLNGPGVSSSLITACW